MPPLAHPEAATKTLRLRSLVRPLSLVPFGLGRAGRDRCRRGVEPLGTATCSTAATVVDNMSMFRPRPDSSLTVQFSLCILFVCSGLRGSCFVRKYGIKYIVKTTSYSGFFIFIFLSLCFRVVCVCVTVNWSAAQSKQERYDT